MKGFKELPQREGFVKLENSWIETPVFDHFKNVVKKFPDKVALSQKSKDLTYLQVFELASSLANQLTQLEIAEGPIGIALDINVHFPVAMMACLALGRPYVPLDINLPADRNTLIVAQSRLQVIISSKAVSFDIQDKTVLYIEDVEPFSQELECLAQPDNHAYIIYTSGSTGQPKGVFQNQRNLLHDVMQYINAVEITHDDRLSLLYSPSVNGALRDIYGALLTGATLYVKNLKQSGVLSIPEYLQENGITIYHSIPNIFRTFLQKISPQTDLSSVRLIYLAGDRIYNSDIELYKQYFAEHCYVYIGIGATEIATIYRQWFVSHDTFLDNGLAPVGYEVEDRTMLLLNENNQEVAHGETGEIAVTSRFVSLGYWLNEELTQIHFEKNGIFPEERTFKTGDLGRINEDGLLEFIGRKDSQTKIDGYRIEVSEIEGTLMKHPEIHKCGVLPTNKIPNELYAFYESDEELDSPQLREWLSQSLPNHMIPKRWIRLEDFPLSDNFKTNYKQLKSILSAVVQVQSASSDSTSPGSEVDEIVKRTWIRFADELSFQQNLTWSESGSSSLEAVHFLVQLESELGVTLPSEWNIASLTPSDVVKYIEGVRGKKKKAQRIIYFPPIAGTSERARAFFRKLAEDFDLYLIHYPTMDEIKQSGYDWKFVQNHIQKQLMGNVDHQTCFLGHCNGSNVLFKFLAETGLDISNRFVGIIDYSYRINNQTHDMVGSFGKIKRLLKSKNLRYRASGLLYERVSLTRPLIKIMFPKDFASYETRRKMRIMFSRKSTSFSGYFHYFYSGGSITEAERQNMMKRSKEFKFVALEGNHDEILNTRNSLYIIEMIKSFLN